MKQHVMFDIDGVLADFIYGWTSLLNACITPHPVFSQVDRAYQRWDDYRARLTNEQYKAAWGRLRSDPTFWYTLPSLLSPEEVEQLRRIERSHWLYFVTNRSGVDVRQQTLYWLSDRAGIVNPVVLVTADKGEAALALQAHYSIEDKAGNAVYIAYDTKGRTKSYIIDRGYNQFDHGVLGSKVKRVATVGEFLDDVEAGI